MLWLMNLGFAAGGEAVVIPETPRQGGSGRIIGAFPYYEKPKKREVVVNWTDDKEEELAKLVKKDAEYRRHRDEEFLRLLEVLRVAVHLTEEVTLSRFQYLEYADMVRAKKIIQEEEAIMLLLIS